MLHQQFMQHALVAGTCIAVACGLVGYLVVLRGQVFAGDALSHVAFTGALAAVAIGIDVRLGLFAATVAVAVGMAAIGEHARADDVVIGTVFAWVLGLGVLFLAVYTTGGSGGDGAAAVRALFGSILGLSSGETGAAAAVAVAVAAGVGAIARPLILASIDPEVAGARGVPVRALGLVFLVLLGVCAAEATQAVGALLLLGLIAAPAGAARRLTASPYAGLAVSAGIAVAATWAGLALSYHLPWLPASTGIVTVAVGVYAATGLLRPLGFGGPGSR